MAKIIGFYIPSGYRSKAAWVPPQKRGEGDRVLLTGEEIGLTQEQI
jgi:hypothetical protein